MRSNKGINCHIKEVPQTEKRIEIIELTRCCGKGGEKKLSRLEKERLIEQLTKQMKEASAKLEFEQAAVIPMDGSVYVILVPVTPMEGVGEDEGVVFVIEEDEDGEAVLSLVVEDDVIDAVFNEYDGLLEEDGE